MEFLQEKARFNWLLINLLQQYTRKNYIISKKKFTSLHWFLMFLNFQVTRTYLVAFHYQNNLERSVILSQVAKKGHHVQQKYAPPLW